MVTCLYHDVGGGRDMRDVIREYEWYYKGELFFAFIFKSYCL